MAKATGIVRRIDDLGRGVSRKEVRRNLRIREGDPLEIYVDRGGQIMLKKYSPILELGKFAQEYAESLHEALGYLALITDKDEVVAVAGSDAEKFKHKAISSLLEKIMEERQVQVFSEEVFPTVDERIGCPQAVIAPIIAAGDPIGTVIIAASDDDSIGRLENKMAETAAGFLARQMEQ
ncbi:MAG: AbrB/MazE/SpoVT family DNA-binding domain-containing protein [Clostridia bacterium]|nr:AbrB/MazE/SpoVT family DNA-binding domain-containing protein [Clostridia bacterium]